jgi:hypothetical protein
MPRPIEDDSRHTSEGSNGGISEVFRSGTQQRQGTGKIERCRPLAEGGAGIEGSEADQQSTDAHSIRLGGKRGCRVRTDRPIVVEEARALIS